MSDTSAMLAPIEAEESALLAERESIKAESRVRIREINGKLRDLRRARAALMHYEHGAPAPSSRRIAGQAAIDEVAAYLRHEAVAAQADIVKATGKNSGTVTHALRVLEADGAVERTGDRRGRSVVWRAKLPA